MSQLQERINILNQIEKNFTYHSPRENQHKQYEKIRKNAKEFAILITQLVPICSEQEVALSKLQEVVMWANAGIAREGAK